MDTGLASSLPLRKLSSVSSFISRPTSSWQCRKEELAAGRNVWRASVAREILEWGEGQALPGGQQLLPGILPYLNLKPLLQVYLTLEKLASV